MSKMMHHVRFMGLLDTRKSCGSWLRLPASEDSMFRFDYSTDFLRWALKPPEYLRSGTLGRRGIVIGKTLQKLKATSPCHRNWHLGVRVKGGGKCLCFNGRHVLINTEVNPEQNQACRLHHRDPGKHPGPPCLMRFPSTSIAPQDLVFVLDEVLSARVPRSRIPALNCRI